jgi:hypothetical protein
MDAVAMEGRRGRCLGKVADATAGGQEVLEEATADGPGRARGGDRRRAREVSRRRWLTGQGRLEEGDGVADFFSSVSVPNHISTKQKIGSSPTLIQTRKMATSNQVVVDIPNHLGISPKPNNPLVLVSTAMGDNQL